MVYIKQYRLLVSYDKITATEELEDRESIHPAQSL